MEELRKERRGYILQESGEVGEAVRGSL